MDIFPFVQVSANQKDSKFSQILAVLLERLPKSCFVYNAVKISPRFPNHSKLFYVNLPGGDNNNSISSTSWIFVTHFTEDHGQNILISSPLRPQDAPFSPSEKAVLVKLLSPSVIFAWDEPHWFVGLDIPVGRLITEICVEEKGQVIEIQPDTLMYMDFRDEEVLPVLDKDLTTEAEKHSEFLIKSLNVSDGTEFISKSWKYSKPDVTNLSVERFLQENESGGVYLTGSDETPVSGIILHAFGLLSMLYTSEGERGKGLAKLAIKWASREMIKSDLFPASSIQSLNQASLRTHEKIGFKNAGSLYWIVYAPH
ncbi:uncharacterized protein LOC118432871 [Folsomia candida]|uniref:uncharacterized protein LOC118432871 n=1 Tax=Folsomia candida TaxID=158441 RepID=UPI000B90490D|nr:uncharacterized protein LOC118432871 [Folsomia candida]